jgi:hypothetical protein
MERLFEELQEKGIVLNEEDAFHIRPDWLFSLDDHPPTLLIVGNMVNRVYTVDCKLKYRIFALLLSLVKRGEGKSGA